MRNLKVTPATAGKSTKFILAMAAGAVAFFAVSCQKEDASSPKLSAGNEVAVVVHAGGSAAFTFTSTFGTLSKESADTNIYTVKNFLQGVINNTGNPPHIANAKYYYRFSTNDGSDSATSDLTFSGTANADLTLRTGTLTFARNSFDSIAAGLVSPTWNAVTGSKVGLNSIDTVNYTVVAGWYNYNIVRHEALPVIEHGKSLTIKAALPGNVNYIIELQDVYSNRTPNAYKTPSNYPYLHFRYKRI